VGAFDKAKQQRAARVPLRASQWVSARFDTSFNHHLERQIIAATDKSKKHTQKQADTTMMAFFNSLWINTMNRCIYPHEEAQP